MKFWQGLICSLACVALALLPASHVEAATVSGRSSTVIEWFDTAEEETAVPVFQYLKLNVRHIGDGYNFSSYGRLGYDLADELEGHYADSRLYIAYLDKKNFLTDNLDMRLGRQFISTSAGAAVMDGLKLDYRFKGKYRVSLFGGGDVTYYEGYSAKDLVLGGSVAGTFFDDLKLGASYVAKVDGGRLAQELLGFDFEYDFDDKVFIYGETQYDYLSKRTSYILAGFKYYYSPTWATRVEYLYSLPVFSSTSIYSVFAVDEYEELMGEITYNHGDGWHAFVRYTHEMYVDFSDASVVQAGIEKIRTEKYSGYLTGVFRYDKDGQDLKGVKLYLGALLTSNLRAGVGVDIDVFERNVNYFDDQASSNETTSRRYWVDATYYHSNKINVQSQLARVESNLWNHYYRGNIRLNVLF